MSLSDFPEVGEEVVMVVELSFVSRAGGSKDMVELMWRMIPCMDIYAEL